MKRDQGAPGSDRCIGTRLRQARMDTGLTLSEVAERSGLTKGFISQLERGLSRASLASLRRICSALDLSLSALLDEPDTEPDTVADHAPSASMDGVGTVNRLLTPHGFAAFQVLHTTVEPGGHSDGGSACDPGFVHFVHVLAGVLDLTVEGIEHALAAGESLMIPRGGVLGWSNPSPTDDTTLLWVFSPPARRTG
ncbi:helix-turn-helix domain-containing protein [Nonomuraea longicatena]|uniref:helix-turn-helix domain-containing protein n=1 Tax=Nonomuraea longicatena TaxID=83682 RepID=UPI0031E256B6